MFGNTFNLTHAHSILEGALGGSGGCLPDACRLAFPYQRFPRAEIAKECLHSSSCHTPITAIDCRFCMGAGGTYSSQSHTQAPVRRYSRKYLMARELYVRQKV